MITAEAPTTAKTRSTKDFWLKIPGRLIDDGHAANMGVYSLAVYIYIAKSSGLSGECYPTHATIARYLAISPRQAKISIDFLVDKGYITRQLKGRLGEQRNHYRIVDPSLASWDGFEQEAINNKKAKRTRSKGKKSNPAAPPLTQTVHPPHADSASPPDADSASPRPQTVHLEIDKDQIAKDLNIPPTPQGVEESGEPKVDQPETITHATVEIDTTAIAEPNETAEPKLPSWLTGNDQPQSRSDGGARETVDRAATSEQLLMCSSANAYETARQAVASNPPWLSDPRRREFQEAMYGAVLLSYRDRFALPDGRANRPKICAHLQNLLRAGNIAQLDNFWALAQQQATGERTELDKLATRVAPATDLEVRAARLRENVARTNPELAAKMAAHAHA